MSYLSVNPELIHKVQICMDQMDGWRDEEGHGEIEEHGTILLEHALSKGRGQIVVFRAVMHLMEAPEQHHF